MNNIEKKLKGIAQELSQLLLTYKWEEAWQKAGELSALLKTEEALNLPAIKIDGIRSLMKSYYSKARSVQAAQKAMLAIGHKLADESN